MILLNDFFTIRNKEISEPEIKAGLHINADHKIFEGHFPNQPIVPGVCMMQMIKEIYEEATGNTTNLVLAAELKFLAVINPQEKTLVNASIRYTTDEHGKINIVASLFVDEIVHFKCKMQLGSAY